MKLKFLLAVTIYSITAFTNAQAADVVRHKQPEPAIIAPAYSWTGFYIGFQGSYGFGEAKQTLTGILTKHNNNEIVFKSKPEGALGGSFIGFNVNLANNMVFGAETDFNISELEDTLHLQEISTNLKYFEKWNGATRVRLGYSVDRVLPYVAGGLAYSNLNVEALTRENAFKADDTQNDDKQSFNFINFIGWTIGAGIDYAVLDHFMVRLEYRYNKYRKKKEVEDALQTVNYTTNHLHLGIGLKF